jgi:short-subunit dehydrogenase
MKEKIILLTGAAGGFGQEYIRQLLREGAQLILTDMDADVLEKKAAEIKGQCPGASGSILGIFASDLLTADGCEQIYKKCKEISPRVDILINNAGILTYGYYHEAPASRLYSLIQINVIAPMHLTSLFVPDMLAARSGQIVFMSSVAGFVPTSFETAYSTSKFAIRGFGMAMHGELAKKGIKVTNIYPF